MDKLGEGYNSKPIPGAGGPGSTGFSRPFVMPPPPPPVPPPTGLPGIKLESGWRLLMESGRPTGTNPGGSLGYEIDGGGIPTRPGIKLESGWRLLLENGSAFMPESAGGGVATRAGIKLEDGFVMLLESGSVLTPESFGGGIPSGPGIKLESGWRLKLESGSYLTSEADGGGVVPGLPVLLLESRYRALYESSDRLFLQFGSSGGGGPIDPNTPEGSSSFDLMGML